VIKRKKDILEFLDEFENYANWDGVKYYLTLQTVIPNGTLTFIKYPNGEFTYHRKNDLYWDIKEIKTNCDMLTDIIWGFRKTVNECIKSKAS
jgi:hypothetical protein